MRPDYCVAFGPSLDCVEFDLKTIIPYFLWFFWGNKQHLLEIHACSIWHWTRVLKTNAHIWGSSCSQEQQRKSGQIRHELWTLINDKPPHPAEETQPPFSLFSPAALLSKSFSCFFILFFLQPMSCFFLCWCLLTHDRNTNTAVERWRRERTQDRDRRELLTAWIWRVLGFTTGAQPAISSMAKPEEDQPSLDHSTYICLQPQTACCLVMRTAITRTDLIVSLRPRYTSNCFWTIQHPSLLEAGCRVMQTCRDARVNALKTQQRCNDAVCLLLNWINYTFYILCGVMIW